MHRLLISKFTRQIIFLFALSLLPFAALAQTPLVSAVDAPGFTVSDMERSLDFFTKVLSFEKVSDVEVTGDEYEHLQGVFGLRMRVVRLRLGGEQIELTEYLAPRDGRLTPPDLRANDLLHWQTKLVTRDLENAHVRLREGKYRLISSGLIQLPEPVLGFKRGLLVRDPDAHALQLIER